MLELPKVIGHRGACAYAPENTIASFDKALSLNCRFVEFDVMCTADGEPYVFHDEKIKRTTNGKGKIGEIESSYLKSLDAGQWFSRRFQGEKVPHLGEALKWLDFSNVQANIEIKPYPGSEEQTTIAVLSHINRFWPTQKPLPLISSFSLEALMLTHSISPELPLGLLMDKWDEQWLQKAQQINPFSVHLNRKIVKEQRIHDIQQQGYKVLAFTINRKRQAKQFFEWGLDAIFSDYPDLLK